MGVSEFNVCPKCGSRNFISRSLSQKVNCSTGDPEVTSVHNTCVECRFVWHESPYVEDSDPDGGAV